ncbi:hypothetical protein OEW28_03980 [Defluviimonas sp. WL0002]|uniref:Uncharacterized protein n=1 Tax=Albidovulum marisflavi TaxID=2984159 RepID=A0ABT2Z9I0_9RHOB|nr:hypothetical protein [Defluviimonas sp. WL0002]MCV2867777.1 hypothetical protein [Defluviimonas sp. WL0002]
MKKITAFLLRLANKNTEQTDRFGQRLTTMTKHRTPRPTRATAPSVFKSRARAA